VGREAFGAGTGLILQDLETIGEMFGKISLVAPARKQQNGERVAGSVLAPKRFVRLSA